jgi:thiol:disulfide interchange protein DsbD
MWWRVVAVLVVFVRPAIGAEDVVRAKLTARAGEAVVEATIARGWHVNSNRPRDTFLIPTTVTFTPPAGVRAGEVAYPAPVERKLAFGGDKPFLLYEGTVRFTAPLEGALSPGGEPLRAALRYQACDDSHCLPPKTLTLTATPDAPAAPGASAGPGSEVARWVREWGYPLTFLWIAFLGVALNLTPCVYPLISVTVAFFGGTTAADHRHAVRRAMIYVVGICLSFSSVGVAAALTGSLFGAALQRPAVLAAIAFVLVGLAGSNFGFYQLRIPSPIMQRPGASARATSARSSGAHDGRRRRAASDRWSSRSTPLRRRAAVRAARLRALLHALPAWGRCTWRSAAVAGRLRRLPRAGAWPEWAERLFGFLLLGLALYFAAPILPDAWVRLLGALLFVSAGLVLGFLGPETPPVMRWPRRLGGVALVAFALAGLLEAETRSPIAWTPFSEDALTQAIAARRPVLIDFEAEWCLPCREMDRTTFREPSVVRAAASFAMLKVDVTSSDERANELMSRYAVPGVPTYVLLGPDGRERSASSRLVKADEMARDGGGGAWLIGSRAR